MSPLRPHGRAEAVDPACTHARPAALPVDAVLHDWFWPDAESDDSCGSRPSHFHFRPAERQQRTRLLSAPPARRLHASPGRCWLGDQDRPASTSAAEQGPKPVRRSRLALSRRTGQSEHPREDDHLGQIVSSGCKVMPLREAPVQGRRGCQSEHAEYWLQMSRPRSHKTCGKPPKDAGAKPVTEDSLAVSLKLAHRRHMLNWWRLFVVKSKAVIKRKTAQDSEARQTQQTRKRDAAIGPRHVKNHDARMGQGARGQKHENVQQRASAESTSFFHCFVNREIVGEREQERRRFHALAINDRYSLPEWKQLSRLPAHRRLPGHQDRTCEDSASAGSKGSRKGLPEALVAVLCERFERAKSDHRSELVWREATRAAAKRLLLQNR